VVLTVNAAMLAKTEVANASVVMIASVAVAAQKKLFNNRPKPNPVAWLNAK